MTETNVQLRQPAKLDYASPIQFRFKCTKLPEVEFTCQTANIPGISLGGATQPTPLVDVPIPGDKINYDSLDITFLVDENLNNYKEIHDWLIGLGFPKDYTQFQNLQASGADRFPGSTRSTAPTGKATTAPLILCSCNSNTNSFTFVFSCRIGSIQHSLSTRLLGQVQKQFDFSEIAQQIF